MLIALTLLTVGFVAVVVWVLRGRTGRLALSVVEVPTTLPADDLPPASAIGWPPGGAHFTSYVDNGVAALDAYLSEGYAA
jgi:hypothetical protein